MDSVTVPPQHCKDDCNRSALYFPTVVLIVLAFGVKNRDGESSDMLQYKTLIIGTENRNPVVGG